MSVDILDPGRIGLLAVMLLEASLAACSPAAAPLGDADPTGDPSPDPTAAVSPGRGESEPDPQGSAESGVDPSPPAVPTPEAAGVQPAPSGPCWGGVLSQHVLLCYVLERVQEDGGIDIEAMYEAPNDVLHVFLRGGAPCAGAKSQDCSSARRTSSLTARGA